MNTSTTLSSHMQPGVGASGLRSAAPTMKALWIAIAFLGLCVLAIGGTLIRQQPSAAAGIVPLTSAQAMFAPGQTAKNSGEMITEAKDGKVIETAPAVKKASVTPQPKSATTAKAPATSPGATAPAVAQAPAKPVCTSCGTVEAVTPVTREGQGSGVGVVAGGVLGGVVGNQVGKGSGRAVATVLGAVGGGWAGNEIEKNMKKTTVYAVRVRMEDGSSRTVEQASAPMVGSKVTVDGGALRPA